MEHDPTWQLIETARPLTELPAHIEAPDGQVSLVAGPLAGDHRLIYLINRIRRPIRADWYKPLIRQVQLEDGSFDTPPKIASFKDISAPRLMRCGSGVGGIGLLPAGAFRTFKVALPSHRASAMVRFVGMYGLMTPPVTGVYDPYRPIVADYQGRLPMMRSAEVGALALGVGLPEVPWEGRHDIRRAALVELQRPRHAGWGDRLAVLTTLATRPAASRYDGGFGWVAMNALCQVDPVRGARVFSELNQASMAHGQWLRANHCEIAGLIEQLRTATGVDAMLTVSALTDRFSRGNGEWGIAAALREFVTDPDRNWLLRHWIALRYERAQWTNFEAPPLD